MYDAPVNYVGSAGLTVYVPFPFSVRRVEGMSRTLLLTASMAAAVLLACGAAVLAAVPVVGQTSTATMVGAGDIAGCSERGDSSATARLLGNIGGHVYTLGDNVQGQGDINEFRNCYDPTWGKYKKRTKPAVGNHEYHTTGAKPYYDYFGARAGSPRRGYYSYDLKSWHGGVRNSNCGHVGGCESNSRQGRWLKNDLQNNRPRCTVAYFHHPLQATGTNTPSPQGSTFGSVVDGRGGGGTARGRG